MASISAQDNFAKWARQKRLLTLVQSDYDKQNNERQRSLVVMQFVLSWILKIFMHLGPFYWLSKTSSKGLMSLNDDIFVRPVKIFLSLPKNDGNLNPIMFYLVSIVSFGYIFKLVDKAFLLPPKEITEQI